MNFRIISRRMLDAAAIEIVPVRAIIRLKTNKNRTVYKREYNNTRDNDEFSIILIRAHSESGSTIHRIT